MITDNLSLYYAYKDFRYFSKPQTQQLYWSNNFTPQDLFYESIRYDNSHVEVSQVPLKGLSYHQYNSAKYTWRWKVESR